MDNTHQKPVDRVASRVVARAPDICKPPQPKPTFMSRHDTPDVKRRFVRNDKGQLVPEVQSSGENAMTAHELDNGAREGSKQAHEVAEKVSEACNVMDNLRNEFRTAYAEFHELMKKAITETREQRIALGSETKEILKNVEDVRKFFLDDKHEREMKCLREMIDLLQQIDRKSVV